MEGLFGLLKKYRRRVIIFLIVFASVGVGVYFVTPCLIEQISTLLKGHQLYQTEVAEGFIIRFELALIIAVVAAVFALLFLLLRKRKNIVVIIISSVALFSAGALFSYFLLIPSAVSMLIQLLPYELHIGLSSFILFCVMMMIVIGVMFEEPLVIYVLYRAGIIKPAFLKSKRKGVYIAVLVLMAVLTPSQDAVTLIIAMVPFVVLYEGALVWIGVLERRKKDG